MIERNNARFLTNGERNSRERCARTSSFAIYGGDADDDSEMAMMALGCLLRNVVHVKKNCDILVLHAT